MNYKTTLKLNNKHKEMTQLRRLKLLLNMYPKMTSRDYTNMGFNR